MRPSHVVILKIVLASLAVIALTITISTEFVVRNLELSAANSTSIRTLSQLFISVAGGLFVTASIPLALHLYRTYETKTDKGKFRKFFALEDGKRPVIVLPQFKVGTPSPESNYKGDNGISLKDLSQLGKFCVSYDDTVALRHLTTLFAEFDSPAPKILFDEDVWRFLNGKATTTDKGFREMDEANTFILVGLLSNSIVATATERKDAKDHRFFKIGSSTAFPGQRLTLEVPPLNVSDVGKWRNSAPDSTTPPSGDAFGLLAKMRIAGNRTAIVIGGENARGTRKLASFLRKNWREVHDFKEMNRKQPILDRPFSISFRIPRRVSLAEGEGTSEPVRTAVFYLDTQQRDSTGRESAA